MVSGKTEIIRFAPGRIVATAEAVARWAGGNRYRPDGKMGAIIAETLENASRLIAPRAAYRFHALSCQGGKARLADGTTLSLTFPKLEPPAIALGAVVLTLGEALEGEVRTLSQQGKIIEALYLDAAGSALLRSLNGAVYDHLKSRIDPTQEALACRFGPGLNDAALEWQEELFCLVDAAAIGVRLSEQQVMWPAKSASFFITLTLPPVGHDLPSGISPCLGCNLKDCIYREK